MGQKTHPTGFRLGITKKHNSSWFSNFKNYSYLLEEDYKIRSQFLNFLKLKQIKNASISKLVINKYFKLDTIILEIHTAFPAIIVGKSGQIFLDNFNKFCTISSSSSVSSSTINLDSNDDQCIINRLLLS